MDPQLLPFYRSHSAATDPGEYARLFESIPDQMEERFAALWYTTINIWTVRHRNIRLPEERLKTVNLRTVSAMLAEIHKRDDRALMEERHPRQRLVIACFQCAMLLTSMLREAGYAARPRFGFGSYLTGPYEMIGHVIVEMWNSERGSWVRMDADCLKLNLAESDFKSGAEAWRDCRRGSDDASRFGNNGQGGSTGIRAIREALLCDVAGLNKQSLETRRWRECASVASLFGKPDQGLVESEIRLLDHMAEVANRVDEVSFEELQRCYEHVSISQTTQSQIA